MLWDFSKLTPVNEEYELVYSTRGDSLVAGTEHGTIYYYELRNDSLLSWGYENSTTLMTYRRPELHLKFPVFFGNTTKDYYQGQGEYSRQMELSAMGTVESEADAYGMMVLPNKDTLRHVLRVRTLKYIADEMTLKHVVHDEEGNECLSLTAVPTDSIEYRLANDSILFAVETYRWYEKGYRYPVFETVRSWVQERDSTEADFLNTAFFYPPQEHYYLDHDEYNLAVLESLEKGNGGNQGDDQSGETEDGNAPGGGFAYYNLYPNPVRDILTVEYYAPGGTSADFTLYTLQGARIQTFTSALETSGIYTQEIPMGEYESGSYILRMQNGETVKSEIIIKK